MRKSNHLLLAISVLGIALMACSTQAAGIPVSGVDAIGTAAAQTVAVQLGTILPGSTTGASTPATPAAAPTSTSPGAASPTPICDQAMFISETVPDGTTFPPGATFTKSWRLKNTGECTWTTSYAIVFDSGNALDAPSSVPLSGSVTPGQEVDLSANMKAPSTPGTYTGYWRLRNASGVLFGLGASNGNFWVKIKVLAPTPTATSSGGPVLHIPIGPIHPPLGPILILPSTQQVYLSGTIIHAGSVGDATVECPSGSVVTSGGFAAGTHMIVYTQLQSGNGWQVYAKNNDSSDGPITVYAVCLSNTSGTTSFQLGSTSVGVSSVGQATATCPSGSVVTGGGFASSADNLWVYNSSLNGNGWQVYAKNLSGSSQGLNVYAICLAGTGGTSTSVSNSTTVPAGTYRSSEAACPSSALATGGGYALDNDLSVYNSSMNPSDSSKWNVFATNSSGSGQLMNVYAICLSLP